MLKPRILISGAASALAALVAGCASTAMVKSYPAEASGPSGDFIGEYGLARSLVTVTLSTPDTPATAAATAAPAAPNVTFSSTINVTTAAPAEKKDGAGETQSSWCAGLRRTYNADRLTTLAAPVRHVGLKTAVASWVGQPRPSAEEIKARVDRIAADIDAIVGALGAFDRAAVNAPLIEAHCPQPFKITITDSLEIDPDRTYRLYAQSEPLSNDRVTTEFDGGYLKSISATGDHRAADVLTNAVKTLASIQTFGAKPSISMPAGPSSEAAFGESISPTAFASRAKALVLKFRNDGYNDKNLEALRRLLGTYKPGGALDPIDMPLPVRRTFTVDELDGKSVVVNVGLRIVLHTECSAVADTAALPEGSAPQSGIWVAAGRSCLIEVPDLTEIKTADYEGISSANLLDGDLNSVRVTLAEASRGSTLLARAQFWALDSDSPVRLPLDRTAFVRRATGYTFVNGRMTKSDVDSPGEAAEIVALPLKLISAFSSAVAEGFKNDTAVTQAETARIQAETARIQAQQAYEAARKPEAGTQP